MESDQIIRSVLGLIAEMEKVQGALERSRAKDHSVMHTTIITATNPVLLEAVITLLKTHHATGIDLNLFGAVGELVDLVLATYGLPTLAEVESE